MNKAEELKQNYIRYHRTAAGKHKGVSLEFANEIEMNSFLQLYADEQSRETAIEFMKDTDEKTALLILCDRCKRVFEMLNDEQYESMFDEWKSNQGEKWDQ